MTPSCHVSLPVSSPPAYICTGNPPLSSAAHLHHRSIKQPAARSATTNKGNNPYISMADQQQPRRGAVSSPPSSGAAELELPGFRFHPTEEELLEFYLKQVAHGRKLKFDIIPTVHLYRHDPWELPGLARIGEREWYFFVPRDGGGGSRAAKQHAGSGSGSGGRPSRTTERGFWKATGSDRAVRCAADPKRLIGLKKTLVYYEGRAPRGTKTDWVMNEYRLPECSAAGDSSAASSTNKSPKEDIVLCKIYRKAVSLKELEQRVAMEELARATATPSASHSTGSPADSMSSSDHEATAAAAHPQKQQGVEIMTMMPMGISPPPVMMSMKKEEVAEPPLLPASASLMRPATLSLPQLEVAKQQPAPQQEWMQDPFLTQLRSPWMESWSPYYASVLNF